MNDQTLQPPVREAVNNLSRQRDPRGLDQALAESLRTLLEPRALHIFRVHLLGSRYEAGNRDPAQLELSDALSDDGVRVPASERPELHDCLTGGGMQETGTVIRCCVDGRFGPRTLIELDGHRLGSRGRADLELVTGLYGNLLDLMCRAARDSLTGLFNRRSLEDRLARLTAGRPDAPRRAEDQGHVSMLALLDIDHFKRINDNHGHLFGDEVLLLFTKLMENQFRDGDQLFRYGGEEFAVLLEQVPAEHLDGVLERFRQAVVEFPWPQQCQVTVSIGASQIEAGTAVSDLIEQADRALYYSKENGRNQVWRYQQLLEQGVISTPETTAGDVELF